MLTSKTLAIIREVTGYPGSISPEGEIRAFQGGSYTWAQGLDYFYGFFRDVQVYRLDLGRRPQWASVARRPVRCLDEAAFDACVQALNDNPHGLFYVTLLPAECSWGQPDPERQVVLFYPREIIA